VSEFQAIDVPVQRCLLANVFKLLVRGFELRPAVHGQPTVALVWVLFDFEEFEKRLATIPQVDVRCFRQVEFVPLGLVADVISRFHQAR